MSAADYVELALEIKQISQKELALRLGVSPTQISKWKKDEHMSFEMEARIKELTKIGDLEPSVVRWAGSVEHGKKWIAVFERVAEVAVFNDETGYAADPLADFNDWRGSGSTVDVLNEMGISPPKAFPKELESEDREVFLEGVESNPYASLVSDIYHALTDVWGFYTAYIQELVDRDDEEVVDDNTSSEIVFNLMRLAASKIKVDESFAPRFRAFQHNVRAQYTEWLMRVKSGAVRARVPLTVELMDMIHDSNEELGETAFAGSSVDAQLHPDIYMNELLVGMRATRLALSAIMKKLGIDDSKADTSV